jgi:alpha-amylase
VKAIVLYLHVHQPYRIKHYTIFDVSKDHAYFNDENPKSQTNNRAIFEKVSRKSYLPTNSLLHDLLLKHPEFKVSLSISGVVLEQMAEWSPETLDSFRKLVATGRVEIVAETYYHSLAFFYDQEEFTKQVAMHRAKIEELFGVRSTAFRNTELAYNNNLASWADEAGFKAILAEGWDPVLDWRSPNYVYRPAGTNGIKLLLKNYRLSDDIAFRFGDKNWSGWPLTADKFSVWAAQGSDQQVVNLFMDYETFGEHQWSDTGIFDFLKHLPEVWLKSGHSFMTVSEAADSFEPVGELDFPTTVTWADTERDLSAWLGNAMQSQAAQALYELKEKILSSQNLELISDWRKLQTSDHFYYMCTKWFNDGDIHAYFSPYDSPYEAYINFMNSYHDLRSRLEMGG